MMEIVSRVLHQGTVRETLHDRKRQSKLIKGSFLYSKCKQSICAPHVSSC
jgi:hypothetical protein